VQGVAFYYRLPRLLSQCDPWWRNFILDCRTYERSVRALKNYNARYVYFENGEPFDDEDPDIDREDGGVLFDNEEDFIVLKLKWA